MEGEKLVVLSGRKTRLQELGKNTSMIGLINVRYAHDPPTCAMPMVE